MLKAVESSVALKYKNYIGLLDREANLARISGWTS
jgi:hypothetical protein